MEEIKFEDLSLEIILEACEQHRKWAEEIMIENFDANTEPDALSRPYEVTINGRIFRTSFSPVMQICIKELVRRMEIEFEDENLLNQILTFKKDNIRNFEKIIVGTFINVINSDERFKTVFERIWDFGGESGMSLLTDNLKYALTGAKSHLRSKVFFETFFDKEGESHVSQCPFRYVAKDIFSLLLTVKESINNIWELDPVDKFQELSVLGDDIEYE